MPNQIPPQAYELIKFYEKLELEAYLCPADVWSIGYGQTGDWVEVGLKITEQQANQYLIDTVTTIANSVPIAIWESLQPHQQAALLSFLYNVGIGALEAPSFGRAIRQNLAEVPLRLLDWDKAIVDGSKQPVLGLTRRRRTEAILWVTGKIVTNYDIIDNQQKVLNILSATTTAPASSTQPINLINAAKYFRGEPQQIKAFEYLDQTISSEQREQFGLLYRATTSQSASPTTVKPWFVFDMPLEDLPTYNIVTGVLRLRGFPQADNLIEWICTSGQPGYQYSGGTKLKGMGPLPGHKYVKDNSGASIPHYWVLTEPYDLKDVKGIEGNAYHILPDPVLISGTWRGEFMIHNDSNRLYSPGSAGCIVTITTQSFNEIEDIMQSLSRSGFSKVPLEVNH